MAPDDLTARLTRALAMATPGSSDHDLNPDTILPEGRVLRPAAVLVGIASGQYGPRVVLTKRSSRLKHHPGQIAFPGGKLDPGDADAVAAALREAREEIGLPPSLVEILGLLPSHETVTGYSVLPVVARIAGPFTPVAEAGEVEEVFDVPLDHVAQAARYSVEGRRWRGSLRRYYTVPYGPYYIWGATARILRGFAERWEAVE